jgi:hypothetical protein
MFVLFGNIALIFSGASIKCLYDRNVQLFNAETVGVKYYTDEGDPVETTLADFLTAKMSANQSEKSIMNKQIASFSL